MNKQFVAISLMLGLSVTASIVSVQADDTETSNKEAEQVAIRHQFSGLATLKTFELDDYHAYFPEDTHYVPAELFEYMRTAIEKDQQLKLSAKADGVIHLRCTGRSCANVESTVTAGKNGPVVWRKSQALKVSSYQRDPRKFARRLVQDLTADYQASQGESFTGVSPQ